MRESDIETAAEHLLGGQPTPEQEHRKQHTGMRDGKPTYCTDEGCELLASLRRVSKAAEYRGRADGWHLRRPNGMDVAAEVEKAYKRGWRDCGKEIQKVFKK